MGQGEAPGNKTVHILVVEDSHDLRLLLELALRDEGYLVDGVASAEDAAQLLAGRRYDLMLTDYSLPGHSGAWLLSQVRHLSADHHTPSVLITGDPDAPGIPTDVVVMKKPIDFDRLLRDIDRIVGDRADARAVRVSRGQLAHPGQMSSPSASASSAAAGS